jgi:hypothetical protein
MASKGQSGVLLVDIPSCSLISVYTNKSILIYERQYTEPPPGIDGQRFHIHEKFLVEPTEVLFFTFLFSAFLASCSS